MPAAMNETFRSDDNIARIAAAYCLDCIDVARLNFDTELDGSEASIALVEQMLGRLHDQLQIARPSEAQIGAFAKMFGSYVGEIYRLKYGAEWGIVRVGEKDFPGMQASTNALRFWPWERAYNRIVDGPENNMWHYYLALLQQTGQAGSSGPEPT
jgi:hypothetical protein